MENSTYEQGNLNLKESAVSSLTIVLVILKRLCACASAQPPFSLSIAE